MFSVYDRHGLQLAYPANWRLEEESAEGAQLQLTICGPGAAFWTLAIYADLHDLDALAAQAVEALRTEYTDGRTRTAELTPSGYPVRTELDSGLVWETTDFQTLFRLWSSKGLPLD